MSGAIYGIVSGSIESTASLALIQSEDRRVETFLDRVRLTFVHLPATATLELKIVESEPLRQELIIRGVSDAFVWGDHWLVGQVSRHAGTVALAGGTCGVAGPRATARQRRARQTAIFICDDGA
jgi:hypothetical protein